MTIADHLRRRHQDRRQVRSGYPRGRADRSRGRQGQRAGVRPRAVWQDGAQHLRPGLRQGPPRQHDRLQAASPSAPDDQCAGRFLSQVGRLLYRRPLTQDELGPLVQASAEATRTVGDFYSGLEITLTSMLQSRNSCSIGKQLPSVPAAARCWTPIPRLRACPSSSGTLRPTTNYWLPRGRANSIHPRAVAMQVDRMLASTPARGGGAGLFCRHDGLRRVRQSGEGPGDLSEVQLQPGAGCAGTDSAHHHRPPAGPQRRLPRLVHHAKYIPVAAARRGLRHSGAQDAPGATPDGWQPYTFPDGDPQLRHIDAEISFLSLHSHPGRTSPTLRGKALRETVLCQKVPDPPGKCEFQPGAGYEEPALQDGAPAPSGPTPTRRPAPAAIG